MCGTLFCTEVVHLSQATLTLKRAERELSDALKKDIDLPKQLNRGSVDGVRKFVSQIWGFFSELSAKAGLSPEVTTAVTGAVVQDSFPSLLYYQRGHPREASKVLINRWRAYNGESPSTTALSISDCKVTSNDLLLLVLFGVVVAAMLASTTKASRGPAIIIRLMESLDLSYDDLGRMLKVSGETVRRWAQRKIEIPNQYLASLDVADSALTRLQFLFLPDRLVSVIRREADLFDGARALDYILQGRIKDVADRYEQVLSFQE